MSPPPSACRHRVSGSISLPSRGSFHLSLTVLVHYRSPVVFSLGGWSPLLHTSFHDTGATQDQKHHLTCAFRLRGCHPLRLAFPDHSAKRLKWLRAPVLQPHRKLKTCDGLGSSPFARRYLGNLILISSPRGTKMFQFPRSPLACLLDSACDARSSTRQVAPFGNPRIYACLRLPVAFRSLPRPSSAPVPRHPPCALHSLDLHRRISIIRLLPALPYSLAKLPLLLWWA